MTTTIEIDGEEYVTTASAAGLIGVAPATVRQYVFYGDLRPVKIGHMNYFRKVDILAFKALPRKSGVRRRKA